MKHPDRTTLLATLLLTISVSLLSNAPAAGQELSAAQTALIEAQAQRHVERYYNFYYERNPEALSTEIFTLPWYTLGANGITARSTEAENLAFFHRRSLGCLIAAGTNRLSGPRLSVF